MKSQRKLWLKKLKKTPVPKKHPSGHGIGLHPPGLAASAPIFIDVFCRVLHSL